MHLEVLHRLHRREKTDIAPLGFIGISSSELGWSMDTYMSDINMKNTNKLLLLY